jgi:hypothetical protein
LYKKCFIDVAAFVEVGFYRFLRGGGEKDDAYLLSFAAYRKFIARKIEIAVESAKFRDPQPGRKEEFQHRPVAQ